MAKKEPGKPPRKAPPDRQERLKSALKANMARRKAQMRARSETGRRGDGAEDKE